MLISPACQRQHCPGKGCPLLPGQNVWVAGEAAQADWWAKYVGLDGQVIGMRSFGESAPAKDLFVHFGFTVEAVKSAVKKLVRK